MMSTNAGLLAALLLTIASGAGTAPASAGAPARPAARVPVLLELFTSEGCSSCPPADDVLSRLVSEQPIPGIEIIGLSEHVDYWNHLGWADPFSDARFTARQQAYARALASGLYTPQAVVDGRAQFVGSDLARVRDAATRAAREPKAAIRVERTGAGADGVALSISEPGLTAPGRDGSAVITLAVTEDHLASSVSRGENQGRRLVHTAVVRRMMEIGRVTAAKPFETRYVLPIEPSWKRVDLRAVVFAQDPKTHAILGVGSVALR